MQRSPRRSASRSWSASSVPTRRSLRHLPAPQRAPRGRPRPPPLPGQRGLPLLRRRAHLPQVQLGFGRPQGHRHPAARDLPGLRPVSVSTTSGDTFCEARLTVMRGCRSSTSSRVSLPATCAGTPVTVSRVVRDRATSLAATVSRLRLHSCRMATRLTVTRRCNPPHRRGRYSRTGWNRRAVHNEPSRSVSSHRPRRGDVTPATRRMSDDGRVIQ